MNERLTRTDVKRDEVMEGLHHGVDYVHDHLKTIGMILGAAAVLAIAFFGYRAWSHAAEERANASLALAQRAFAGAIDPEAAKPDDPDQPSFATVEQRRERAAKLFEAVRQDHGGGPARVAAVYLGRIASERGNATEARRLWEGYLRDEPEGMLAAAVSLDLLRLDRQEGKGEAVVQRLEEMLRQDRRVLPDDVILFELARTLAALGRGDEARPYLQRILDEFPRSAYRTAAQQELTSLQPRAAA